MLPAAARLRRPAEFAAAVRTGARASRGSLVLYLHFPSGQSDHAQPCAQVGFVIGRPVGSAVARNRLRRRLRALLHDRIEQLPSGSRLVVRARPGAAQLAFRELEAALDAALGTVLDRTQALT